VERATVNGIVTGKAQPSRVLVKVFRYVLMMEGALPGGHPLRQAGGFGDEGPWRRRAQRAERRLEDIRAGLLKLLERTTISALVPREPQAETPDATPAQDLVVRAATPKVKARAKR
jgi:hypothetical protein